MKLKQEKMLSASPKTIDITWFLKKSCIATRTKIERQALVAWLSIFMSVVGLEPVF